MITTGPKEIQNVKDKNKMKKTGRKTQRIYSEDIPVSGDEGCNSLTHPIVVGVCMT
jgi:hypothetical protein